MTEQQYLNLKEQVTIANRLHGRIAAQKKTVEQWTRIEHKVHLPGKKDWAKSKILYHIEKLAELKKEFENL